MSLLKEGAEVLIKARVVRQAFDKRKEKEKGYLVRLERGEVYVNPSEIINP